MPKGVKAITRRAGRWILLLLSLIAFCLEATLFISTSRSFKPPDPSILLLPSDSIHAASCNYSHTWEFLNCLVNARDGRTSRLIIDNMSLGGDAVSRSWIQGFLPQTTLRIAANASSVRNDTHDQSTRRRLLSDHVLLHVEGLADLNILLSADTAGKPTAIVSSRLFSLIPAYTIKLTVLIGRLPMEKDGALASSIPLIPGASKLQQAFPLANISFVSSTAEGSSNYLDSFPINLTKASMLICYQSESFYCALSALILGDQLRSTIALQEKTSLTWLLDRTMTTIPHLVHIDSSTKHGPTVAMRSKIGSWSYNDAYGKRSFYEILSNDKIWVFRDEFENQSMPTTYGSQMWDTFDESLEFLNLRGFCQAMHDFGKKTRIMVVGDSLQYMHMVSFLFSLGMSRMQMTVRTHYHKKKRMRALQPIECPAGLPNIDLIFYRANHAMALSSISKALFRDPSASSSTLYSNFTKRTPEQEEKVRQERHEFMQDELPLLYGTRRTLQEYYRCYGPMMDVFPDHRGYCPWHNEYLEPMNDTTYSASPPNTLIYIGVGAHFHHENAFEESLHHFMRFVDDEVRPDDSVWFRTVSPGHEGCGSAVTNSSFGEPYKSFAEYLKHGQTEMYDWNKFQYYNRAMENAVWDHERLRAKSIEALPSLALVDIYWMTALRKDGHSSSVDCLHYLLPGPPDWWSHIFHSQLVEAAAKYASRK